LPKIFSLGNTLLLSSFAAGILTGPRLLQWHREQVRIEAQPKIDALIITTGMLDEIQSRITNFQSDGSNDADDGASLQPIDQYESLSGLKQRFQKVLTPFCKHLYSDIPVAYRPLVMYSDYMQECPQYKAELK
jgi:hypothetical protein